MSFVDDYLATIKPEERAALEHVRQVVLKTLPNAEETKSYGMPAFRYKGKYLLAFFVFKEHMSIFPGAAPIEAYKAELKDFTTTKGAVHFTVGHPLSDETIRNLVLERAHAIDGK